MNTAILSLLPTVSGPSRLVLSHAAFSNIASTTGCTLLDRRTAELIVRTFPLIMEWGAGNGEVGKRLLETARRLHLPFQYRGFDISPSGDNVELARLKVLHTRRTDTTLLLSAPPTELCNDFMARDAVEAFTGRRVIYIGGDATGGPALDASLRKHFPILIMKRAMPLYYTVYFNDGATVNTIATSLEVWRKD